MQITINLSQDQILLLATKLGYELQIEDTSQPLDGDSYPLIDNPVTLQQFTETTINETLMQMILDRLRADVRTYLDNEYNKVTEKLAHGRYDNSIMTLGSDALLQVIIGDIVNG